jgi:tubulin-specific chaperone A
MPAPSPLHIATQVVQRLVKEEKSYHKELEGQQKRVEKLKADMASGVNTDENAEYILKQEVRCQSDGAHYQLELPKASSA